MLQKIIPSRLTSSNKTLRDLEMSNKRKVLIWLLIMGKNILKDVRFNIAQTDVDIEILISDDNSTDNTLSLVNNYVSRNKISILYNEKLGHHQIF